MHSSDVEQHVTLVEYKLIYYYILTHFNPKSRIYLLGIKKETI